MSTRNYSSATVAGLIL